MLAFLGKTVRCNILNGLAHSEERRLDTPDNREAPIRLHFGSGLHAAAGRPVDASAYEQYFGRWSRLFVPAVLAAAAVASGDRVLDVATGPGEAALLAMSIVAPAGRVIGADIAPAMLTAARARVIQFSMKQLTRYSSGGRKRFDPHEGFPGKARPHTSQNAWMELLQWYHRPVR